MYRQYVLPLAIALTGHLAMAQNPSSVSIQSGQDRVEIGTSSVFEFTNTMTIEAWVKPDFNQPVPFGRIVDKFSFVDQEGYNLILNGGSLFMELITTTGQSRSLFSNAGIQDGNWHHVAGTFSGNEMILYVDGVLDNSDSFSSSTLTVSTNQIDLDSGVLQFSALDAQAVRGIVKLDDRMIILVDMHELIQSENMGQLSLRPNHPNNTNPQNNTQP